MLFIARKLQTICHENSAANIIFLYVISSRLTTVCYRLVNRLDTCRKTNNQLFFWVGGGGVFGDYSPFCKSHSSRGLKQIGADLYEKGCNSKLNGDQSGSVMHLQMLI